jgi:hypothetical protein
MNRFFRLIMLLFWLELGLGLIVVPWSEFWDANFFLYQYPVLAMWIKNPFLRGAISGLGLINVFLSLETFRRGTPDVVTRT